MIIAKALNQLLITDIHNQYVFVSILFWDSFLDDGKTINTKEFRDLLYCIIQKCQYNCNICCQA